jgi:N-acyl-D-amino-acid deacylase
VLNRRNFVKRSAFAAGAFVSAPGLMLRSRYEHDIVIRGGAVFDGLGAAPVEMDIGILNGRVVEIGRSLAAGRFEIDARGLAVGPGFVDIHSHGDGTLWDDPKTESLIRQGITTIIVGQDGGSRFPREEYPDDANRRFPSFGEFQNAVQDIKPAVNVASMIGLGTVRAVVVGRNNRPATSAEIDRMTQMVSDALKQGACGVSSGLEYTPGAFAPLEEIIAVCRPLALHGLPYATHMRNEDDRLLDAIEESIAVARGAGSRLQISHLKTQGPRNWPRLDEVFARLAAAASSGLDVAFDRYPYVAYQTGLTNLFPVWSRDGGSRAFLNRLENPDTSARIRNEALAKVELIGGWNNVQISDVNFPDDTIFEGRRLGNAAAARGLDPYVFTTELLKRNRANVGMVGFAMSEENLDRILAHPRGMVCSDGGSYATSGPAQQGHPHPRSLGSFPRVLARYVRERKTLTLELAIQKMSSQPASRVKLSRGTLAIGQAADIVVFNPNTVADRATFAEPFQYPAGIKAVIVNGSVALLDGARGDQRTGTVLRATT